MEIIKTLIWVIEIISAIAIVILVLLQHGKGADAGATFGSGGSSGSLFGASGSSNFLSRATAIAAAIFFATTLALVLMLNHSSVSDQGVMANLNGKKIASGAVINSQSTSNNTAKTNSSGISSSSEASGTVKNQIPQ